jgi:hypothetical protein
MQKLDGSNVVDFGESEVNSQLDGILRALAYGSSVLTFSLVLCVNPPKQSYCRCLERP